MRKYAVDWSDSSFPKVVPAEKLLYDPTEGCSFAEAKQEIISHFEYMRDDARDQIRATRALRISDIEKD